MVDKGQFGSSMSGGLPERKDSLSSKPIKPIEKAPPGVFGKEGFLKKGSLSGKLMSRQDFYTDPSIKMDTNKRKQFAEKLKTLLPQGKTTLNPSDVKIADKRLRQQEFSAKTTQEKFEIKREREALKKFFDIGK